jgi:OOP family OmpA-OmpF porin
MFTRVSKLLLVAGLGFGLSACAQLYNDAMNATSNGPAFNDALFSQYQKLAKMEADEQDWLDADFFGERALATAGGNAPDPQALDARDLPAEHVGPLTGARNQLTAALEDGARDQFPQAAAEAQAGFDCWMQEAEENIQPSDIQWCKDLFWKGMNAMDVQPAPAPKPKPKAVPTGPWIVYFDFDDSEITYDGQLEINKAVNAALKAKGSQVLLTAHTDTSGSEQYNLDLSARRAKSVVDAMELISISRDRVTASAVGESDPAVATGDGVSDQANRRVEVRLSK